jgi:signal transduction histidine kinase
VTLSDNGPGIAPEHQQEVFEPFFSTKAERGSGLGLWVTRSVLQTIGGSVLLRSRTSSPSGTLFSIFIPGHPEKEAAAKVSRIDQPTNPKHVV